MTEGQHNPVLKSEVLKALRISDDSVIVDATYGRGGHTRSIMAKLGERGRMLIIDRDPEAIAHARQHWGDEPRVIIVHAPFSAFTKIITEAGLHGLVSGILIDLGVSSPQLDQADRGFSFSADGPLDMRMDPTRGPSAAEWLVDIEQHELIRVLRQFGEEKFARRIAARILEAQQEAVITGTAQLAQIVSGAVPRKEPGKHPATRTFQALRIAINNELDELDSVLPQALDALAVGGRLLVISFHSLEDRRVKRYFREQAKGDPFPPDLPVQASQLNPVLRLVGKQIRAGEQELSINRRARSAVLRVAEKL